MFHTKRDLITQLIDIERQPRQTKNTVFISFMVFLTIEWRFKKKYLQLVMKFQIEFLHVLQLSSEGDQSILLIVYILLQKSHGYLNKTTIKFSKHSTYSYSGIGSIERTLTCSFFKTIIAQYILENQCDQSLSFTNMNSDHPFHRNKSTRWHDNEGLVRVTNMASAL